MSYKKLEIWQLAREVFNQLYSKLKLLGKKINKFLQAVENQNLITDDMNKNSTLRIKYPASGIKIKRNNL